MLIELVHQIIKIIILEIWKENYSWSIWKHLHFEDTGIIYKTKFDKLYKKICNLYVKYFNKYLKWRIIINLILYFQFDYT